MKEPTNLIQWSFNFKVTSFNTYQFQATAIIEHPWRLYSLESLREGSLPTTIEFENNLLHPIGDLIEVGKVIKDHNPKQNINTSYYANRVEFIQNFQVFVTPGVLKGTIYYTPCTDDNCVSTITKEFQVKAQ